MIITLTGPSCCGKTSLLFQLLRYWPDQICSLISSTTRPPREREVEGVSYYFVDESAFDSPDMIQQVKFDGNLYGLTKQELQKTEDASKVYVAVVNIEGARWLKEHYGAINIAMRVNPSVARYRLARRDGEEAGRKRYQIDVEYGLYDFQEFDFKISCTHKKWANILRCFVTGINPFLKESMLPPLNIDTKQSVFFGSSCDERGEAGVPPAFK